MTPPTGPALTSPAYLWALPCTAIGLVLGLAAAALAGASWRRVHGTIEIALRDRRDGDARPGRPTLQLLAPKVLAITFGHVILGVSRLELQRLRTHERAHVAQYERWGPFFLLAYPLASLWPWLRGGDAYRDNPFEVQARRAAQGVPQAASGGGLTSRRSRMLHASAAQTSRSTPCQSPITPSKSASARWRKNARRKKRPSASSAVTARAKARRRVARPWPR